MTLRKRDWCETLDMEDEKVDAREDSEERKRGARSMLLRSGVELYIVVGGGWFGRVSLEVVEGIRNCYGSW